MTQPTQNKAAVLKTLKNFEFENRPYPKPAANQVVVRIKSVGVCGSDVHYYAHGACGSFKVTGPIILGHESAGIIAEVGPGVTNVKTGDRVALEPGIPCRRCEHCRTGRYNLCADVQFLATPPYDGSLAQYILHDADFVFKLPDHVSFEEGALLEPLSVGMYACERAQVTVGHKVLVMGAGPIGLVNLLAAKAHGATTTVVADVKPDRLEVAKALGATHVFNSADPAFVDKVKAALGGQADIAIDCTGVEAALRAAVYATKSGGRLVCVGLGAGANVNFPLFEASIREIDIVGVFRYRNIYPKSLDMVASGRINLKPLVTHRYSLEQVAEAFDVALTGRGNPIKVAVNLD